MFYISSKKYFGSDLKYGVTDSEDNVEEFYSKDDLAKLFHEQHIYIKGMTYTGSSFRFEVTNLNVILASSLRLGDIICISINNIEKYGIFLDITSLGDGYWFYFEGDNATKITKTRLLNDDCKVTKTNNDKIRTSLYKKFKEVAPNHNLWSYKKI